jgi:hypothetical protein
MDHVGEATLKCEVRNAVSKLFSPFYFCALISGVSNERKFESRGGVAKDQSDRCQNQYLAYSRALPQ